MRRKGVCSTCILGKEKENDSKTWKTCYHPKPALTAECLSVRRTFLWLSTPPKGYCGLFTATNDLEPRIESWKPYLLHNFVNINQCTKFIFKIVCMCESTATRPEFLRWGASSLLLWGQNKLFCMFHCVSTEIQEWRANVVAKTYASNSLSGDGGGSCGGWVVCA